MLARSRENGGILKNPAQLVALHGDVLKFCKAELLEENHFHAILQATKSIADKIRSRTGLTSDGAALVDAPIAGVKPRLALNRLVTDSETSEQPGFCNLMKGVFGAFRNQMPTNREFR